MKPRIIVIGGSAGSMEPLLSLIGALPVGLLASVFVVMHLPAWHRSFLPSILARAGTLPAIHPATSQEIECGVIYVAPPDQHMIIKDSKVELWRGPKEDRNRPSINALFRTAAVEWKDRVIGTILSGALEDGAAGFYWIKEYGGTTIVQNPATAISASMPLSALQNVQIDHVADPKSIGPLIRSLTATTNPEDEVLQKRSE